MVKKTKKLVVSKSKRKVKKTGVKTSKLTKQEKFWNQAEQQSHYLIADLLNQVLPLPNLRDKKNLDLNKDADYRTLFFECENNYHKAGYSNIKRLVKQIAYDYLLLVVKSLLKKLSDFDCHFGFEELYE